MVNVVIGSLLYICHLTMSDEDTIKNAEFKYKWFSKDEIMNSNNIVESDKMFIEEFYIKRSKNYLKLDCYINSDGEYYWK